MAYWRKAWGISNLLQQIATNPKNMISCKEDYETHCYTNVLSEVITEIAKRIRNINDNIFTNSFVNAVRTRFTTVENLARICATQSWIRDPENKTLLMLMSNKEDFPKFNEDDYEEFLNNKNNYEVQIVFQNSC